MRTGDERGLTCACMSSTDCLVSMGNQSPYGFFLPFLVSFLPSFLLSLYCSLSYVMTGEEEPGVEEQEQDEYTHGVLVDFLMSLALLDIAECTPD